MFPPFYAGISINACARCVKPFVYNVCKMTGISAASKKDVFGCHFPENVERAKKRGTANRALNPSHARKWLDLRL